jgi:serine/threonine-protein kinase
VKSPSALLDISLSPDGRWLAYRSVESGRDEVFVRPYPQLDAGRWQVSLGGGNQPAWARSGRELFFRGLDGSMMTVSVTAGSTFSAGMPTRLFQGSYDRGSGPVRNYDATPDASRFLMIKPLPQDPPRIVVVEHWFEELKAKVPGGK